MYKRVLTVSGKINMTGTASLLSQFLLTTQKIRYTV